MLDSIFHRILKYALHQFGDLQNIVANNGPNRYAGSEIDESGEWVNISIKACLLPMVAIKDDRLPQAECHRRLGVLSIAFLFSLAVDQHLCALDHQAFD